VPLNARERRVLGVLIEKQKTTPEYYPMSISAVATGCNQKSNRDPVTNYDVDDVEEILEDLRRKGVAILVEGSGRVPKWKHNAYEWLGLKGRPEEMAVLAELLLRGPQTEGELRQRASRMDEIPDLPKLQTYLSYLNELGLVHYLTPEGQRRGAVVAHGLYPPEELARLREAAGRAMSEVADSGQVRGGGSPGEVAALREEVETLKAELGQLRDEVERLKRALGA
jgi:uncharacterized protein YceH (UPF0502 family)